MEKFLVRARNMQSHNPYSNASRDRRVHMDRAPLSPLRVPMSPKPSFHQSAGRHSPQSAFDEPDPTIATPKKKVKEAIRDSYTDYELRMSELINRARLKPAQVAKHISKTYSAVVDGTHVTIPTLSSVLAEQSMTMGSPFSNEPTDEDDLEGGEETHDTTTEANEIDERVQQYISFRKTVEEVAKPVRECIEALEVQTPCVEGLDYSRGLSMLARDLASNMSRVTKVLTTLETKYGVAGDPTAVFTVTGLKKVQDAWRDLLLICRSALFESKFKVLGVGWQPHSEHNAVMVVIFAHGFQESVNVQKCRLPLVDVSRTIQALGVNDEIEQREIRFFTGNAYVVTPKHHPARCDDRGRCEFVIQSVQQINLYATLSDQPTCETPLCTNNLYYEREGLITRVVTQCERPGRYYLHVFSKPTNLQDSQEFHTEGIVEIIWKLNDSQRSPSTLPWTLSPVVPSVCLFPKFHTVFQEMRCRLLSPLENPLSPGAQHTFHIVVPILSHLLSHATAIEKTLTKHLVRVEKLKAEVAEGEAELSRIRDEIHEFEEKMMSATIGISSPSAHAGKGKGASSKYIMNTGNQQENEIYEKRIFELQTALTQKCEAHNILKGKISQAHLYESMLRKQIQEYTTAASPRQHPRQVTVVYGHRHTTLEPIPGTQYEEYSGSLLITKLLRKSVAGHKVALYVDGLPLVVWELNDM